MRPLFLAALLLATPATAATLRPLVTLDSANIRVADLFDDAGPDAARILGPSPAPGSRIVVEASQLAAIARQFGIDWRPAGQNDRIVLDRPGRILARDIVLAALRAALAGIGAPADIDIELPGYSAPLVPQSGTVDAAIEQLDWDGGTGRFTSLLAISADGMAIQRIRLSGIAQEMVEVPVPIRRLNAGSVIQPDDLKIARVRLGHAGGDIVRTPAQAAGMTLRRQAVAGQPIAVAELTRTATIQKGARVTMQLRAPGLALAAHGQALEAGALGEHIRILNPVSRAIVEAEVIGPDLVRVLPGGQPTILAPGRTAQLAPRTTP